MKVCIKSWGLGTNNLCRIWIWVYIRWREGKRDIHLYMCMIVSPKRYMVSPMFPWICPPGAAQGSWNIRGPLQRQRSAAGNWGWAVTEYVGCDVQGSTKKERIYKLMVYLMYGYINIGLHPAIIFIAFYLESSHPTEPGLWSIELSQPPDKLIQINSHGFSNKEGKFEPIGNWDICDLFPTASHHATGSSQFSLNCVVRNDFHLLA